MKDVNTLLKFKIVWSLTPANTRNKRKPRAGGEFPQPPSSGRSIQRNSFLIAETVVHWKRSQHTRTLGSTERASPTTHWVRFQVFFFRFSGWSTGKLGAARFRRMTQSLNHCSTHIFTTVPVRVRVHTQFGVRSSRFSVGSRSLLRLQRMPLGLRCV
jgi:hypothetical protein